jgi:hypothetical protein
MTHQPPRLMSPEAEAACIRHWFLSPVPPAGRRDLFRSWERPAARRRAARSRRRLALHTGRRTLAEWRQLGVVPADVSALALSNAHRRLGRGWPQQQRGVAVYSLLEVAGAVAVVRGAVSL